MYIYELPFDINRELCRLLDMDDTWKELAGEHMKYTAFNIIVSTYARGLCVNDVRNSPNAICLHLIFFLEKPRNLLYLEPDYIKVHK